MFLNHIKDFFVKKLLKNRLRNVKTTAFANAMQTVGLLIDKSHFSEKEALIKALTANGISEKNLKIIVYSDKFRKKEVSAYPAFGPKHLNWNAKITDSAVNDFINEKFDLLINYYDIEKAILLVITRNSKAHFKVGFSAIDKRLNHLIIDTKVENHEIFTHELFKYIKNFKQNIS